MFVNVVILHYLTCHSQNQLDFVVFNLPTSICTKSFILMDHPFFEDGATPVLQPLSQAMCSEPWPSHRLDCLHFLHIHLDLTLLPRSVWSTASLAWSVLTGIITSWPAGQPYFNEVICFVCDMSTLLVYVNLALTVTSGPFWQGWYQPIWFPALAGAWGFYSLSEQLCTWLCWTSWCLFALSSNLWSAPFVLKLCLLSCQKLLIYYPRGYKKLQTSFCSDLFF